MMEARVKRARRIAGKALGRIVTRRMQAGHGFSFYSSHPGTDREILRNSLPAWCEVRASAGRVFVCCYPW